MQFYLQIYQFDKIVEPVWQETNLSNSIKEVTDIMKPQVEEKLLKISYHNQAAISKNILFDKKLMQQVLINLISNAIKFSFEAEEIDIFSKIDKVNKKIIIRVVDYGIGIV